MSKQQSGLSTFLRGVFTLLIVILAVPLVLLMIGWLSYQSKHVNAQHAVVAEDRPAVDRVDAESQPRNLEQTRTVEREFRSNTAAQPDSPYPPVYRPVTETEFHEKQIDVFIPEVDPNTGQTVMKKRPQTVRYPHSTTRWTMSIVAGDPRVQQLVSELRVMDENDESRERKMKELGNRLESEFMQMHEKQAEEIAKTQQRLESLQKAHQQRGENKDKIVQRRIDDLLGNDDSLQWTPNLPPSSYNPILRRSTTSRAGGPVQGSPIGIPGPPPRIPGDQPQVAGPTPGNIDPRFADPPPPDANRFDPALPRPNTPKGQNSRPAERVASDPIPDHAATTPIRSAGPANTSPPRTSQRRTSQQRSSTEDNYAVPPMNAPRVEGSTSVISRLFQLARDSADAEADLAESSIELKELTKLSENGAASDSELRKAKTKHEKLANAVRLNKIEFEALAEALGRDLKFAEAAVASTAEKRAMIEAQVKQGIISQKQLLEVEFELSKARNAYEHARASLDQLNVARDLEQDDETEQPAEEE